VQADPSSISYWSSAVPTASFPARIQFASALSKPSDASSPATLFVVAGLLHDAEGMVPTNDSYISTDNGNSWTCQSCKNTQPSETPNFFSPRFQAGLGAAPNGALYLLGGLSSITDPDAQPLQELWSSTDSGVTWANLVQNGPWGLSAKEGAPSVHFDANNDM
jgi:hypothetical protein